MLGFRSNNNQTPDEVVSHACDYADTYHYVDPEKTTYYLRRALNQISSNSNNLDRANQLTELMIRGVNLDSNLRSRHLSVFDYENWLSTQQQSIATAKLSLKQSLRSPWRDHYDWLGQSLAHSSILENAKARRAYENLAILYRVQNHLLKLSDTNRSNSATTKSGYQIEQVLRSRPHVINKANRIIDYYHRPNILS